MKAIIVSIIAKLFVIIAVLAFVFGIVFTTKNYNYLWLLWLLLTVWLIPTYTYKRGYDNPVTEDTAKADKES